MGLSPHVLYYCRVWCSRRRGPGDASVARLGPDFQTATSGLLLHNVCFLYWWQRRACKSCVIDGSVVMPVMLIEFYSPSCSDINAYQQRERQSCRYGFLLLYCRYLQHRWLFKASGVLGRVVIQQHKHWACVWALRLSQPWIWRLISSGTWRPEVRYSSVDTPKKHTALLFHPEDGDSTFLQKRRYFSHYTLLLSVWHSYTRIWTYSDITFESRNSEMRIKFHC